MLRWQRILCWFGAHDPMVRPYSRPFMRDRYRIVCRCCGKEAS